MTRADFLRLLTLGALGATGAQAVGEKAKLKLCRLTLPGLGGEERPGALARLMWELTLRTSIIGSFEVEERGPDDPRLFETPLLYLWGARAFAPLPEASIARLRRHLEFGGLLLADDGSGVANSPFAGSVEREARRIFPGASWSALPDEHSVFRTYYLLRRLGGRSLVSPFLEGVTVGDRTPLLLCRNDLLGAWAQDGVGRFLFDCSPGGESQRQQAFALGVNVVLYALTVNYKQDQIHLPFILQRMRRR